MYELASLLPKTTTHTSVVYTDSVVTSVSTSIGLIPIAPPKATTSFFSSDTTNVVSGPTATGPSIYFGTGHIGHTDHIDHTDHTDDSDEADQSVHSGEVDHSPHTDGPDELDQPGSDNQKQSSDSDDDMENRTTNIYPQNFRGVVSESADVWLRQFLNYCAYKGYDDDRAKALFRVLLVECAAVWFDSLEVAIRQDWTQLKAAFLARYTTPEFMKYKHATELFSSKQGERSVDDFCAYMQNLAREIKADEHMLCYAVINGLKSEIKNHVTRLRPATWKDLADAAKVGEMCVPETPAIGSSVTVQLELIQDQLKELSAQRSPSSAPVGRPDDRPLRSPSPRRVRFDDRASEVTLMMDAVMMFRALVITTARRLHLVILVSADVGRSGDIVIIVSHLHQISIGAMTTINSGLYLDNRGAEV